MAGLFDDLIEKDDKPESSNGLFDGGAGGSGDPGGYTGGGAGAGGYRESPGAATCYTASPLGASPAAAVTVTAQAYPIVVTG